MNRRTASIAAVVTALAACVAWLAWTALRDVPPPARMAQAEPGSIAARSDIPRIDVHVHVPPERAEEAVAVFGRHGVVLALNASGGHPGPSLDASVEVRGATQGRLLPYCNISFAAVERPAFSDYVRRTLEACRERGAVGLKIFKSLGLGTRLSDGSLLRVDDPRLDVVFEVAGALSLPVLIHTGDPQAFFRPATSDNERYAELSAHPSWAFYGPRPDGQGRWPSWQDVFEQYELRVARSPGTTFVGAHFGNAPEDPEIVSRMLDTYPNLYVETGARIPEIGRHPAARMRALFLRHQDRILFGTDIQLGDAEEWTLGSAGREPDPPSRIPAFYEAHWRYFETDDRRFAHPTPIQGEWTIDGIDLPRDVLERVYHRNAERVFGLSLDAVE